MAEAERLWSMPVSLENSLFENEPRLLSLPSCIDLYLPRTDIVIACEGCKIGFPEVKRGVCF